MPGLQNMNHEEWKLLKCPNWDINCWECIKQKCLDDTEYECDDE